MLDAELLLRGIVSPKQLLEIEHPDMLLAHDF